MTARRPWVSASHTQEPVDEVTRTLCGDVDHRQEPGVSIELKWPAGDPWRALQILEEAVRDIQRQVEEAAGGHDDQGEGDYAAFIRDELTPQERTAIFRKATGRNPE